MEELVDCTVGLFFQRLQHLLIRVLFFLSLGAHGTNFLIVLLTVFPKSFKSDKICILQALAQDSFSSSPIGFITLIVLGVFLFISVHLN